MNKKDFNKKLCAAVDASVQECKDVTGGYYCGHTVWAGHRFLYATSYAAVSERCMELQLSEVGKERKTTFMADLSLAEWYGVQVVADTVKQICKSWRGDVTHVAEFVLCLNWKAWEHDARKNRAWSYLYSVLFENIRDLFYDYYEGNEKDSYFLYSYLD